MEGTGPPLCPRTGAQWARRGPQQVWSGGAVLPGAAVREVAERPVAQADAQRDAVPLGDVEVVAGGRARVVVAGVVDEAVLDAGVQVLQLGDGTLAVLLVVAHPPVLPVGVPPRERGRVARVGGVDVEVTGRSVR